jgi:hypothetical protein
MAYLNNDYGVYIIATYSSQTRYDKHCPILP